MPPKAAPKDMDFEKLVLGLIVTHDIALSRSSDQFRALNRFMDLPENSTGLYQRLRNMKLKFEEAEKDSKSKDDDGDKDNSENKTKKGTRKRAAAALNDGSDANEVPKKRSRPTKAAKLDAIKAEEGEDDN